MLVLIGARLATVQLTDLIIANRFIDKCSAGGPHAPALTSLSIPRSLYLSGRVYVRTVQTKTNKPWLWCEGEDVTDILSVCVTIDTSRSIDRYSYAMRFPLS